MISLRSLRNLSVLCVAFLERKAQRSAESAKMKISIDEINLETKDWSGKFVFLQLFYKDIPEYIIKS